MVVGGVGFKAEMTSALDAFPKEDKLGLSAQAMRWHHHHVKQSSLALGENI
jgi:hypothetical protein